MRWCLYIRRDAPLKRQGVKPGNKVSVVGIGGLGHFGVQRAKAMGAEVVAISSSKRKQEDANALGCGDYVVIDDEEAIKKHAPSFSHILCTLFSKDFNWYTFFSMMAPNSTSIWLAYQKNG